MHHILLSMKKYSFYLWMRLKLGLSRLINVTWFKLELFRWRYFDVSGFLWLYVNIFLLTRWMLLKFPWVGVISIYRCLKGWYLTISSLKTMNEHIYSCSTITSYKKRYIYSYLHVVLYWDDHFTRSNNMTLPPFSRSTGTVTAVCDIISFDILGF